MAHKTHATMEMIVAFVVLNPESMVASNTSTATRTSPMSAIRAATPAILMNVMGRSQQTATTHITMATIPPIQANHHPANDKTKAKMDKIAGRTAP